MSLFSFLHGESYESEAEAYMKKRNKDYIKRSNMYKRQEQRINGIGFKSIFDTSHFNNGNHLTKGMFGAAIDSINDILKESTTIDENVQEKQEELKKRLQEKYGCVTESNCSTEYSERIEIKNDSYNGSCDECDDSEDEYAEDEVSVFEINTVQQIGYTFKLCGRVTRGRFMCNNIVKIRTSSNDYTTKVTNITRQGESVNYANSASGVIVITIPYNTNYIVRNGDKLFKNYLG